MDRTGRQRAVARAASQCPSPVCSAPSKPCGACRRERGGRTRAHGLPQRRSDARAPRIARHRSPEPASRALLPRPRAGVRGGRRTRSRRPSRGSARARTRTARHPPPARPCRRSTRHRAPRRTSSSVLRVAASTIARSNSCPITAAACKIARPERSKPRRRRASRSLTLCGRDTRSIALEIGPAADELLDEEGIAGRARVHGRRPGRAGGGAPRLGRDDGADRVDVEAIERDLSEHSRASDLGERADERDASRRARSPGR